MLKVIIKYRRFGHNKPQEDIFKVINGSKVNEIMSFYSSMRNIKIIAFKIEAIK